MGLTSLQVCMDASDWLQGGGVNEGAMDSSASSGDIITCSSRPMLERRLRPPHDQALKCPRCDSTHTKFCYYNNYSLSQPRYFCKTCRRYWTKGGSLRNIPVGGGCRKNKRSSSVGVKKNTTTSSSFSSHNATDLHLSFPELQLSHLTTLLGNNNHGDLENQDFMENKINGILETPNFMDNKFDSILGNPIRGQDFMAANTDLGLVSSGLGDVSSHGGFTFSNSHNLCSPYGISLSENGTGNLLDSCQRLQMLPFDGVHHHHHLHHLHHLHHEEDPNDIEVKPNKQLLSIDWQDQQGCSDVGKDSFGYFSTGIGSWSSAGVTNGYGSSATNPLV